MEADEYKIKMSEINKDADDKKSKLNILFATKNKLASIGDIVEDHIGKVIIEKMQPTIGISEKLPSMRYLGKELKKNGEPRKDNSLRWVYESNMINPSPQ